MLDSDWDPADVLVFVSQLATSAGDQSASFPDGGQSEAFMAERRNAIKKAVQRPFPARAA